MVAVAGNGRSGTSCKQSFRLRSIQDTGTGRSPAIRQGVQIDPPCPVDMGLGHCCLRGSSCRVDTRYTASGWQALSRCSTYPQGTAPTLRNQWGRRLLSQTQTARYISDLFPRVAWHTWFLAAGSKPSRRDMAGSADAPARLQVRARVRIAARIRFECAHSLSLTRTRISLHARRISKRLRRPRTPSKRRRRCRHVSEPRASRAESPRPRP